MTMWDTKTMLEQIESELEKLILPDFSVDEELIFDKLYHYGKVELQTLLLLYAQQKAYLEEEKAKRETFIKVQQGAYDDNYYVTLYEVCQEYQNNKIKKPPQEELKAEIISKNENLRNINKNIVIDYAVLSRINSWLEKVTTQYYTTKDFLNRQ